MKYIKKYEDLEEEPKVGDYVICDENVAGLVKYSELVDNFLLTNIGKILVSHSRPKQNLTAPHIFSVTAVEWYNYQYLIQYENVPENIKSFFDYEEEDGFKNCRGMERFEIKYFSSSKEDLEILIDVKKYKI